MDLCVCRPSPECRATNAIFHVDGGIDFDYSPLPIPGY
jgi:7-alpha-hydroxysteroid dehydrogenase